jgi:hypothetical protein
LPDKPSKPRSPSKPLAKRKPAKVAAVAASASESDAAKYEAHRADMARRSLAKSLEGRDIGGIAPVADWDRRRRASRLLRRFCETYGGEVFRLGWSRDHRRTLVRLQQVVTRGGQFALAMPRGSGKTSMVTWAALWSMLTGRRRMVVIVGADARAATQILEAIAGELESNDRLAADFPEACYPIRRLEGIPQRASGQLCLGARTHIGITADELTLPTVPREALEDPAVQTRSAGSVVRCVGITGRLRGMQARTASGQVIRPSLVLIDDPQTDESAKSPSQCDDRERLISGAILGMAGPAETLATLATVTVIRPDDLADRLLTPSRHPDWRSERTRLVYDWGTGEALWREYAEIRRDPGKGPQAAQEFYAANREAMDAGAVVGWSERRERHQLSALQYAWDLRIDRGEAAFGAEYQNEPVPETRGASSAIEPEVVISRACRTPRGIVPSEATVVTAGIDVQGSVIYWLACAWTDAGRGWVIDYGTVPEQSGIRLELAEIATPLSSLLPDGTAEERISLGCKLAIERVSQDWRTETGGSLRIDRILIDAGWGQQTGTVRSVVKASRAPVNSSKGFAIGAKHSTRIGEGRRRPGERVGLNWRMTDAVRSGLGVREVQFDSNWWKGWVANRFGTVAGVTGSIELCGDSPADLRRHRRLAEQLAAEECVEVEARGRRVSEWMLRRPGLDNHLFDCLVLSSVAANIAGVRIRDADPRGVREAEVEEVSLADVQRRGRRP